MLPGANCGVGGSVGCLFSARNLKKKIFFLKKIAFSHPGEKQRAGVEDNALLRGAFLDVGARLSPEGGKRERPANSVKAAGGSRDPPAFPCSQENSGGFAHPRLPTVAPTGPCRMGGLEKVFRGAPPGSCLPSLLFCVRFKRDSHFAPAGQRSKAAPRRGKALWEGWRCG